MAAKLYKVGDVIDGNLKLTEKIGEGVFLSKNVDMPELKYVVKIFDKLKMNQADIADYKREICIMKKLSGHPNIVQYINNFETANYHYLIMEYYETDLFDVIVEIDGLETSLVKRIFSDITQGLNYAHQNGIYHRDIKVSQKLTNY
jgi:serine/threonine protein kinase